MVGRRKVPPVAPHPHPKWGNGGKTPKTTFLSISDHHYTEENGDGVEVFRPLVTRVWVSVA